MQKIELYIQGQRVELFKDESITITESIQNVKDIEKVFTAFTQSFSVPASKTNNKIFKHYYNFDIVEGFDARKKISATIELNSMPFKTGKIKLEGVDMKNNKPHTYRITFFGDIVDLKDKLGEKKLSDLDFTSYNLDYDATTVEAKLTTGESSSNHIIAPLITHSQRLFFNSDGSSEEPDDGNLKWFSGGGSHVHGLKWNELKYAIRVNKIIEQIEAELDLEFSSDFFKNTSLKEFDHLFLWLHRKSGAVEDLSGTTNVITTQVDGWTPENDGAISITNTTLTADIDPEYITEFKLDLNTLNTSDSYNVEIIRDGESIYKITGLTGRYEVDAVTENDFDIASGDYTVFISSTASIIFTSIVWRVTYDPPYEDGAVVDYSTGSFTLNSSFTFNINRQMPDIKIIDFLTGLFKLFNLTAFVENGVIIVKPLNDFYANPTTYDITEFVDINSSKVDVALPYREIEFKFKDTKTFLANKFGELENREWGSTRFSDGENDLAGQLYKVEVPFGHLLYERLVDPNNPVPPKNIQWGYNVDKSQNAYLGSPLLFYSIWTNTNGISFVNSVDENNVADDHKVIYNVNLPSNSPIFFPNTDPYQLNFSREQNEWTGTSEFSDTLYEKYYSDYIADVFNTKTRLTKLKAYLPLKILLNYNLGDRFIVAGNQYKINSISTNLLTGESNLELLNKL